METTEETKIITGLFQMIEKCRISCFLYDAEQDLMTAIDKKMIPFWINSPAYLLLTDKKIPYKDTKGLRLIETDAFQLERKYDKGDLLVLTSLSEGNTECYLAIQEEVIDKLFSSNAANEIKILRYNKTQVQTLNNIQVPVSINHIGLAEEDRLDWESKKNEAEEKLKAEALTWDDYKKWVNDLKNYKVGNILWEEKKIFEIQYTW